MGDERCLSYRRATPCDAPFLATMNRHLIEDEGHCNPMTVEELAARMGTWLSDDYAALLVLRDDEPFGYACGAAMPTGSTCASSSSRGSIAAKPSGGSSCANSHRLSGLSASASGSRTWSGTRPVSPSGARSGSPITR